jgi:undecaprenyl-diphosphatase
MDYSQTEHSLGIIQAIILGIIQGATEFLPVSSSGHLALAEHLSSSSKGSNEIPFAFDMIMHLATVLVVIKGFWKDIKEIIKSKKNVLLYIFIGSIPAGICGILWRDSIDILRNYPAAICISLMLTGIALIVCEKVTEKDFTTENIGWKKSLFTGIFQALALIPGISRSGLTITGSVICGLKRNEAIKFSFLLMLPAVCGGLLVEALRKPEEVFSLPYLPLIAGFISALITGTVSLQLLKKLVTQKKLKYFSIYCFALGLAGIVYFYFI